MQKVIIRSEAPIDMTSSARANDNDKILGILDTKLETQVLRCSEGTCEHPITTIRAWVPDTSAPNILWISGPPGVGKSTLASHVAELFRVTHRLGVIVEFNRITGVTAIILWKTVAYALAREYPECRNAIVSKLKSDTFDLAVATSSEIFTHLVAEPLQQLTAENTKVSPDRLPVVVIDDFDECCDSEGTGKDAREEISDCFVEWEKLAPGVKLIVTSQAGQENMQAFSRLTREPLTITIGASTSDIQTYFKERFKKIAADPISSDWPGDKAIADLVQRTQGIFAWADIALNFIDDPLETPESQLKLIQDWTSPQGNLQQLYSHILEASFPPAGAVPIADFIVVAGAAVALQQRFTCIELSQFLGMESDAVESVIKGLRAVLDKDVVRFRHQSFVDFLTGGASQGSDNSSNDSDTCPKRFRIDIADAHSRLCESSFRLMNKKLYCNICNVSSSFTRSDELPLVHFESTVGRPLAYACRFWGVHLSKGQPKVDLVGEQVTTFICDRLLPWFECLSGLRFLSIAVPSLVSLDKWLPSSLKQVRYPRFLLE